MNSAWIAARSDGVRVGFCGDMFDDGELVEEGK